MAETNIILQNARLKHEKQGSGDLVSGLIGKDRIYAGSLTDSIHTGEV